MLAEKKVVDGIAENYVDQNKVGNGNGQKWEGMVTALCSEGSMFRRFYVQKIFVQKVLCSEGSIFKRSYIQKVLCSEGHIFRYIQKVLYSENYFILLRKNLHLSVSGELQCKITNHNRSF